MMGMGGDVSMGMSTVFTTAQNTPLFSPRWTPNSTGTYAGTCIFLAVFAILSRLLQAYQQILEVRWHDKAVKRRYIVLAGDADTLTGPSARINGTEKSAEATLTTNGVDERVRVLRVSRRGVETQPWRLSTDLPRSCLFTIQSGMRYLLMLAVMTVNVGYFLSVLAGLFVGELAVGRYAMLDDGHH